MKKIGYLLLVALLAVLMLVSCGGEEECAHSFSAATCTTPEICTLCGIEQGTPNGHKLVKGEVHSATCTVDGYTDYACSECDFTVVDDKVSAPGHKYHCAASAAWTEESKLYIKVQIIDKYFGILNIVLGFRDDKLGLFMTKTAEDFLWTYEGFATGTTM